MAVYEGNEKYIFVSYAHKDSPIVLPVIEALQKNGFRVWYDGGIEAGTEWPEYIADHLERCAVALIFISNNALASQNCTREIHFAISERREILAVYLSKVNATSGVRMQLGSVQAMYYDRFIDDESFINALMKSKLLLKTKIGYTGEENETGNQNAESDDLSAFFGVQRGKKKAKLDSITEYSSSIPISIYRGAISDNMQYEVTENVKVINTVLMDAKIDGIVSSVEIGPRVTTYIASVSRGLTVRLIMKILEDIKLSLGVEEIRMATLYSRGKIGFEIPNTEGEMVYLEELLREARLREEMNIEPRPDTSVCLGRSTSGEPIFADIAKFPHLLMSGITQTGKTTLLHSIIISMITRVPKERIKLVLVDLKGVEFDVYNNEGHLLLPVIHDSETAAKSLEWIVNEMERRYRLFIDSGVRSIEQYNEDHGESLPRIIFIVDDYTDLIYTHKKEIDSAIMRLSQKSRAAGIHVILSTQRPDTTTVTPYIKANIPSRILFKTTTQAESRTIIESGDAYALLHTGDALYQPVSEPNPSRIHTPYIPIEKIEGIVKHLKKRDGAAIFDVEAMRTLSITNEQREQSDDELLDVAARIAIETGSLSTSLLQRKLMIGYGRAVKIIDRLTELGVISEYNGAKPRMTLIDAEQWAKIQRGEV